MPFATLVSGCPPAFPACAPERLDPWPYDGTPGTLLIVACILAACAAVLTLALLAMLITSRKGRQFVSWRALILGTLLLNLFTILGAQRAWASYQPYSRLGLPPDASYWQWYDRLAGSESATIAQLVFTFEVAAGLAVILTVLARWKTARRASLVWAK